MQRPYAILFGDSLTQRSFDVASHGWGAQLANYWAPKIDVHNRGFSGYNTRWAGYLMDEVFGDCRHKIPSLVVLFWGANDSCLPPSGQHVPLDEYERNLGLMVDHTRSFSEKIPVIIITPPMFILDKWKEWCVRNNKPDVMWQTKRSDVVAEYRAAALRVAADKKCTPMDLYGKMQESPNVAQLLCDGLHLSKQGNEFVWKTLQSVIETDLPTMRTEAVPMPFPYWADVISAGDLDSAFPGRQNQFNMGAEQVLVKL